MPFVKKQGILRKVALMLLLKRVANHTLRLILVLHLLLYRLQAKNDVYIFKWLEEK